VPYVLGGQLVYLLAFQRFLCLYFLVGFIKAYMAMAPGVIMGYGRHNERLQHGRSMHGSMTARESTEESSLRNDHCRK